MIKKIIKYFKRKRFDLRQACINAYGEEFGVIYDKMNSGEPIGGFVETCAVLDMINNIKRQSGLYN
jgi:hypothetical protein